MADYIIGLDFGTSQTKVCLFDKDNSRREFIKFDNGNYFLPSLIVKNSNNTFSYGKEDATGAKYRYFKMSAAEDQDLIQVTHEDLEGNLLNGTVDDFRKYSTDFQIKSEILVVLYLTYIYLFIKQQKTNKSTENLGGLLGKLSGNKTITNNKFSINLGIPTEWNNPYHIKRKIKFESLLITAFELANYFDSLDTYLKAKDTDLLKQIEIINKKHLAELEENNEIPKATQVKKRLKEYKLSVFPESAAGVNYLLKTRRLENGSYATLDIGAGTSDIAIFEVQNNVLRKYYCSESVEIAANDFYREYAKKFYQKEFITFEEIREIESIIRKKIDFNSICYNHAKKNVKGFLDSKGIEFAVRKVFYRKYYKPLHQQNPIKAYRVKNEVLNEVPIIVFGGGANLEGFCDGNYCFYRGNNPFGNENRYFDSKPITDFVKDVDIEDKNNVKPFINLLILALGLTFTNLEEDDNNSFLFDIPDHDFSPIDTQNNDRYFYYDLQDAVYK
jgi:hypothetical protein